MRSPIVRLRYTNRTELWQLYWRDSNLRWHVYDLALPSRDLATLLAEVDRDPVSIFWG
jgi:hypothetical protein